MLFPDIKSYFIELEEQKGNSEEYINALEGSYQIDDLISAVAEYYGYDDFEAAEYILKNVS